MRADESSGSVLMRATIVGTVLQLAMVIAGHFNPTIALAFGLLGMTISAVAGGLYAAWSGRETRGAAARGGAIAGGVCALVGIAVSFFLGDVALAVLVFGTLSSAVAGALGALVLNWRSGRASVLAS